MVDFGYNNPVCISKTYSNYKTDNAKYFNMSKFEFSADNYKKAYLFNNYNDAYALAQQLNSTSKDISATYPNASVGYYWANYKNCVVTTVYIDVAVPVYSTGLMPDTATERYSKLGAGWEFDFPYIEKNMVKTDMSIYIMATKEHGKLIHRQVEEQMVLLVTTSMI